METKGSALLIVAGLALVLSEANAYKETTHADIAKHAIERAGINDASSGILKGLGLGDSVRERRFLVPSPMGVSSPTSVEDLLMRGAREEDHGVRSLQHFFDPQRDGTGLPLFEPSPIWALE